MHYILDEPKNNFSFFISMFYLLQYVGDCCKLVRTYEYILQNRNRVCNRVCAKNLVVSMLLEEISKVQPRMSRDVAHSTPIRSRTTENVHASALLVLQNLENVARIVGGWLLLSRGSSSISGGGHDSIRI